MDPTLEGQAEAPPDLVILEEEEDELFDMQVDSDELVDFTYDEPEEFDEPMLEEEETPADGPIAHQNTMHLRARLDGADILSKVKRIFNCMQSEGLNLPLFLDAVFYGDAGCHNDAAIQYQRTALMVSDELPILLERWYQAPSRGQGYRGQRPLAAKKVLVNFAQKIVNEEMDREMKRTAKSFLSSSELLSKEHLLNLNFNIIMAECRTQAPMTWSLFRKAAYTVEQEKHNTHKNPDMVSLWI